MLEAAIAEAATVANPVEVAMGLVAILTLLVHRVPTVLVVMQTGK
jgi:hypothetical protein